MKNLFTGLFLFILMSTTCLNAKAVEKFEEYVALSKPCAILIYADWAEKLTEAKASYTNVQSAFAKKYNFASVNIANKEGKAYNQKFDIYKNLPYVVLFKENGKFSRYIQRDCILDTSCIKTKMDLFAN